MCRHLRARVEDESVRVSFIRVLFVGLSGNTTIAAATSTIDILAIRMVLLTGITVKLYHCFYVKLSSKGICTLMYNDMNDVNPLWVLNETWVYEPRVRAQKV